MQDFIREPVRKDHGAHVFPAGNALACSFFIGLVDLQCDLDARKLLDNMDRDTAQEAVFLVDQRETDRLGLSFFGTGNGIGGEDAAQREDEPDPPLETRLLHLAHDVLDLVLDVFHEFLKIILADLYDVLVFRNVRRFRTLGQF